MCKKNTVDKLFARTTILTCGKWLFAHAQSTSRKYTYIIMYTTRESQTDEYSNNSTDHNVINTGEEE